ncbi:MAG: hypothetical protein M1457_05195 [bacterium]|nr:hypothetical protein [bacterium]
MEADAARGRYKKIRLRFVDAPPAIEPEAGILSVRANGRTVELLTDGAAPELAARLRALNPEDLTEESLTLEEIFVATGQAARAGEAES